MAYIYMPLIFTVLGYSIAYIALTPVLDMLQAVGSMVIAKEAPNFNTKLNSIYDPSKNQKALSDNEVISVDRIKLPDFGTQYANITCEKIKLDAPVYWGDTNEILKAGVGNFMGSFMPGFGKSILLSGHNTTYFRPLKDIAENDIITIDTNYGTYKYKVKEIKVLNEGVAANMRNEILSQKTEKLYMYTCYPFKTLVGRKTDRLFVFADKISGPAVKE